MQCIGDAKQGRLLARRTRLATIFRLAPALILLIALMGCLSSRSASADEAIGHLATQNPVAVPNQLRGSLSLDGHVQTAIDPTGNASLAEMFTQHGSSFKNISGHDLNLGYARSAGWMRFVLQPDPQALHDNTLLLSLTPNFSDIVEVYIAADRPSLTAADFVRVEMGDHAPLLRSAFTGLENILPIEIPAGGRLVVYIRGASVNSSLNLSVSVYSPVDFGLTTTFTNLARGLWFGGMTILMIVQIIFFCFDRKAFYLLLALNILGATLVYFGNLGLSRLLLFPEGGLGNDYFTASAAWLGLTTGALSVASVLELRLRYPWLDRFFLLSALIGVAGVVFAVTGENRIFAPLASLVILVVTTAAMIVSLHDFITSKDAESGLKAAAFILIWTGLILTSAQRLGIFPLANWVAHSYALTSVCHFILLTGSLAVRLRTAETMNRDNDKRAVAAAYAAERHANELVLERTRELAAAKKTAEDALQAELQAQMRQVRFMEVISHQYRTPLAVIRSNIDSVLVSLPRKDQANMGRLDRARQAIARLVEVLEVNLLRSQLQGASFKPEFSRIPVTDVITAACTKARDLLQGASIQLDLAPEATSCSVMADAEMLGIALINLLENAVKFSAGADNPLVVLGAKVIDGKLAVSVQDNGIGIPPTEIDAVLSRAVRGSNARHVEGSGVGLSLVSQIVAAHRGSLDLSAQKGGPGTIATIILPLATR
ncbi:MAG: hypothetical protein E6Q76_14170 [Rhizobium sp.]|nr:MAG: hypothetical protein E6Q76_14170 [Rhizobium sp.]